MNYPNDNSQITNLEFDACTHISALYHDYTEESLNELNNLKEIFWTDAETEINNARLTLNQLEAEIYNIKNNLPYKPYK